MEQVLDPAGLLLRSSGWVGRAAAWLRRIGSTRARAEAPLRVEARLSLGPKKSLVLVRCQGRQLLLAVAGDSIAPLLEMPATRTGKTARAAVGRGSSEARR
ncbi:MAG TPA: flagellar biosynthetic protein FliO [Acidobacteriaceae bacterium]|nr:flagellar biosynthetic protein FliO [Acidobacteriaceae bacterium]